MFGFSIIPQNQRAMVTNSSGEVRYVDGPQVLFAPFSSVLMLLRYSAGPDHYLVVRHRDGTIDHIGGPAMVWLDPVLDSDIQLETSTHLDSNEALVVYTRNGPTVSRRVIRGPALFVPTPQEWIHEFRWHGTDPDPKHEYRKIPRALRFTRLRVIPDQMYFNVENVRTADDALLVVKLMVFFELDEIETMLDQTHDPIADFINALSADVIDFVGHRDFDGFKNQTNALNDLACYPQLTQRAHKIGYRITKVVYRGYYASDKLQMMHDNAIECRTKLRLEAETERQAQELADLKLTRELERAAKRRQMDEEDTNHRNHLRELEHIAQLRDLEAAQLQALESRRRQEDLDAELRRRENEMALAHQHATHQEQTSYFSRMRDLQVDLTRYLVAQFQNPDKLIRIDRGPGGPGAGPVGSLPEPQLHLHDR